MNSELPPDELLVWPFPMPGKLVALAYHELDVAAEGTDEQKAALGPASDLPRPWDPGTCIHTRLRHEIWSWLEAVAAWLNHEYVFDPIDAVPPCWPLHPHLVHELAVLADQRRRATYSFTSDAMEEWHRYSLPQFIDRLRRRIEDHCSDGHASSWPAQGRFTRYVAEPAGIDRNRRYAGDLRASPFGPGATRSAIVDPDTGEIFE